MPLSKNDIQEAFGKIFNAEINQQNEAEVIDASVAFQDLVMHYIETNCPALLGHVCFDKFRLILMLRRFYRDAFGVRQFAKSLDAMEKQNLISAETGRKLIEMLDGLSIRIKSDDPKKTRVAAAFSLWMATLKPVVIATTPKVVDNRVWRLDATVNFWIAGTYLRQFGTVGGLLGKPDDPRHILDCNTRLRRIWYDFTFRDLNLSSLEFMYASIYRPD